MLGLGWLAHGEKTNDLIFFFGALGKNPNVEPGSTVKPLAIRMIP